MANIAVIGTGYVGLTTGACFAHLGHTVVCADIDPVKVERLKRGEIPIVEKDLERFVNEGLESGRLSFVLGAQNASRAAEFHYLCVPTPQGDDGAADLSYLQAAAAEIAPPIQAKPAVLTTETIQPAEEKPTAAAPQAKPQRHPAKASNPNQVETTASENPQQPLRATEEGT